MSEIKEFLGYAATEITRLVGNLTSCGLGLNALYDFSEGRYLSGVAKGFVSGVLAYKLNFTEFNPAVSRRNKLDALVRLCKEDLSSASRLNERIKDRFAIADILTKIDYFPKKDEDSSRDSFDSLLNISKSNSLLNISKSGSLLNRSKSIYA